MIAPRLDLLGRLAARGSHELVFSWLRSHISLIVPRNCLIQKKYPSLDHQYIHFPSSLRWNVEELFKSRGGLDNWCFPFFFRLVVPSQIWIQYSDP